MLRFQIYNRKPRRSRGHFIYPGNVIASYGPTKQTYRRVASSLLAMIGVLHSLAPEVIIYVSSLLINVIASEAKRSPHHFLIPKTSSRGGQFYWPTKRPNRNKANVQGLTTTYYLVRPSGAKREPPPMQLSRAQRRNPPWSIFCHV